MNPYQQQSQNYAQTYKTQQVQTASQEEILILLYEGAIRFLRIARKAMEADDLAKAHTHLIKTQNIISEFMASLDMEIGGEAAKNLYQLYEYLHYRLVQANIKKDVTMVDEVLEHLRSLKTTWEQAIDIAQKEKSGGSGPQQASNTIAHLNTASRGDYADPTETPSRSYQG